MTSQGREIDPVAILEAGGQRPARCGKGKIEPFRTKARSSKGKIRNGIAAFSSKREKGPDGKGQGDIIE